MLDHLKVVQHSVARRSFARRLPTIAPGCPGFQPANRNRPEFHRRSLLHFSTIRSDIPNQVYRKRESQDWEFWRPVGGAIHLVRRPISARPFPPHCRRRLNIFVHIVAGHRWRSCQNLFWLLHRFGFNIGAEVVIEGDSERCDKLTSV